MQNMTIAKTMHGAQTMSPRCLCSWEPTFEVPSPQAIDHKQQSPCSPSWKCVWCGLVQQVSVSLLECLQRLVPCQRVGISVVIRAIHDTVHALQPNGCLAAYEVLLALFLRMMQRNQPQQQRHS